MQKLEVCLLKTEAFCHFTFFTFHVIPLPPKKELQFIAIKIPQLCFVYLGFGWGKQRNRGFMDGCFCSSCKLLQQSEGEN